MIRSLVPWLICCLLTLSLTVDAQAAPVLGAQAIPIYATQDTRQLYVQGLTALDADQPELARQTLERVVELEPGFAGAWLDLALATYRSGDHAAALEHLEYLSSQFTLPPALAIQVEYWRSAWQTPQITAAPTYWQGEISLGVGYDSNANAGLGHSQMALSLPAGNILFDIDSAYLPRPDRAGQFDLALQGPALMAGAGRLSPVVLLHSKYLAQENEFNTLDLQPGLIYQHPAEAGGRWQANLFAQHYRLGGQALLNGLRFSAQRMQAWTACQGTASADVEVHQHQRAPALSGTQLGFSGGLACRLPGSSNIGVTLGVGHEQVPTDRPGGNNQRIGLTLRYDQPLGIRQNLQVTWQIANTDDQYGYSPLLQDNAIRNMQRQTVGLVWRQTLATEWEGRLSYEYFQQRSNLPLFEQQGRMLMLSLAYLFR